MKKGINREKIREKKRCGAPSSQIPPIKKGEYGPVWNTTSKMYTQIPLDDIFISEKRLDRGKIIKNQHREAPSFASLWKSMIFLILKVKIRQM